MLELSGACSILYPMLLLHPEFSSLDASEYTNEPNCNGSVNSSLCLQYDLHDSCDEIVGFNNTIVFCLVFFNCATGFPVLITLKFARDCILHRNFKRFTRIFVIFLKISSSGSMK